MANKGDVLIEVRSYLWECGDGCCTESGYEVDIELNGKSVLNESYTWDYDGYAVKDALEALGYSVTLDEGY